MKTYKGVKYIIKQNPKMLFWLAYIRLPDGHRWTKKKDYNDIPLDVHGGVTYMSKVTKENIKDHWQGFSEGTWVGWDYGHAGDFIYCGTIFNSLYPISLEDKRWEYEEVEKEVKDAIRQVLK